MALLKKCLYTRRLAQQARKRGISEIEEMATQKIRKKEIQRTIKKHKDRC